MAIRSIDRINGIVLKSSALLFCILYPTISLFFCYIIMDCSCFITVLIGVFFFRTAPRGLHYYIEKHPKVYILAYYHYFVKFLFTNVIFL